MLALRIVLWRMRPFVLPLVVVAAVAVGIRHLAPPPPQTQPVVVTAHEVPAGRPLTGADLRVVQIAPRVVPDGALSDPDELIGRSAAVPLPRGLPVVASVLEGDRFGLDPPPGTVVVPVRLADGTVPGFLRIGDLVDLVVPGSGFDDLLGTDSDPDPPEPDVLARRALVVDVAQDGRPGTGSSLASLDGEATRLVVMVAVPPEDGRRLAAAGDEGSLGAVLVE